MGIRLLSPLIHYRPPEHKKVEWYYQGISSSNTEYLGQQLLEDIRPKLFPTVEKVVFEIAGTDETYGAMQLMAWLAAGQGDLYILQQDTFKSFADKNTFVDLSPYVNDGTLNVEGIDLTAGMSTNTETSHISLLGIPCDTLQGLWFYDMKPEGAICCLPVESGNVDNAIILLDYLLENLK